MAFPSQPFGVALFTFLFFYLFTFPQFKVCFCAPTQNGLDAALDAMNRMKKVRVSAQGSKIVVDAML
ncbi:hypothetical protein HMPREF9135_1094 [Segatella baroniae F0067]|uniref:Uncharacterized protein n=1 Tax=Segatella baroniae F0067 TaxID=1115809 RepID=U2Q9Z5_9BACT|nr:hypothetical protein HMPREF9135_1094 [Segatella baroniae F0067]